MEPYQAVYDDHLTAQSLDLDDQSRLAAEIASLPRAQELIDVGQATRHFYNELSRTHPTTHGCPWVRGALYVNRHGDVTTCCMVKDTERHALGKVGKTSVQDIVSARSEIDRQLCDGRVPEQCAGCNYLANSDAS